MGRGNKNKINTRSNSINSIDVEFENHVRERDEIIHRLKRINEFTDSFNLDTGDINLVDVRLSVALESFKEFSQAQSKVESYTDISNTSEQKNIRLDFENLYYSVVATLKKLIASNNNIASATVSNSEKVESQPQKLKVNLPTINLPTFDGNFIDWIAFRDTFISVIHNNATLSNIEKFHYLRSALKGDALSAINSLNISNINYLPAWELLKKRFENKRLIVQAYIRNLINLQPLQKTNHELLRRFIDNILTNVEALKNFDVQLNDALVVTLLTDKLDFFTNKEWQAQLHQEIPTLTQFTEFLETRCQNLESISFSNAQSGQFKSSFKQKVAPKSQNKNVGHSTTVHVAASHTTKPFCVLCKKNNHFIFDCTRFLKMNVDARLEQVNILNLCKNCLRSDHMSENCNSRATCKECQQKHNTLLHKSIATLQTSSNHSSLNLQASTYSETLLSTAVIYILDKFGKFHECRALLDSGSQSNFITDDLCTKLGIETVSTNHQIFGINMTSCNQVSQIAEVHIRSKFNEYSAKLKCLVLKNITQNLPLMSFSKHLISIPKQIKLADPHFNVSNRIDLLLGCQIFYNLLRSGQIHLKPHNLYLQNTVLGYVLGGNIPSGNNSTGKISSCNLATHCSENSTSLSKQLSKFWAIDGMPEDNKPSQSILQGSVNPCEKHFADTVRRSDNGRFIVTLPIRDSGISLGDSFQIAKNRFLSLERKFQRDHNLFTNYRDFMREYENLGHMQPLTDSDINVSDPVYYIPHHAVYKNSQIRVVFDASCKSSNSLSLNDNLNTGPTIQDSLFSILLRFRSHNVVIKADIKKMYRQILINPKQLNLQRILWRENSNDPLNIYQLSTVTYGVTSSPFLAVRCLTQLGQDFMNIFPEAAQIILEDFYIDDLLTGCKSEEEAITLKEQLCTILSSAGFELAKWASNKNIFEIDSSKQSQVETLDLEGNIQTKTLGIHWNCKNDLLTYKVESVNDVKKLTKRHILSVTCKIFDPLGLVSPLTIRAKILLQELWKLKLDWNAVVPQNIANQWYQLINDLQQLNKVQIPRLVIKFNSKYIQLHGFADASEKAYGSAIYLKSIDSNGDFQINLLVAKSRVAPLKSITIPRLELQAALLLAQLTHNVIKGMKHIKFDEISLYTDSTIVLAWLAKPPSTWKTFVCNRVAEIQSLTQDAKWHHVSTSENPADLISRGTKTENLLTCKIWWNGPTNTINQTSNNNILTSISPSEIPEAKIVSATTIAKEKCDLLNKFSDFTKLVRYVAWIFRFINNCKNKTKILEATLTVEEFQFAKTKIIKLLQAETFSNEIHQLQTNKHLRNKNPLLSLSPRLDDGVLRVGGRLGHANISFDKKYPILLPKSHHVTKLIINQIHAIHYHAGAQATLAAIRQAYWIVAGRSAVRAVLSKCVTCYKSNPQSINQKMGDLPKQRLEPIRPFYKTGVDYCGPINIRESRGRGRKTIKAYICLFICLCTKAVHLELVCDLTADGFINSLKRFMARRGIVKEIHSDNATNFVGANKQLQAIFKNQNNKNKIMSHLTNQNIHWRFIPPRTPNFGGLWEANIKSAKSHLKKVVGQTILTYDEMYTLLTQIEACLNSRPLVPLSSDPNDLSALTPGHFLIGEALTALPEPNLLEIKIGKLSRFQLLEYMRQHFWKRWHKEYVTQLQAKNKAKCEARRQPQPGDLVLLVEDGVAPLSWPLGRIQQVFPGGDGLVRVVEVKTCRGVFKRGVSKVCILPIN